MLMSAHRPLGDLENPSEFIARHIGISAQDETLMLGVIGEASRRALIESIVPRSIARSQAMQLPAPVTEAAACAYSGRCPKPWSRPAMASSHCPACASEISRLAWAILRPPGGP